ncbi:gliding motility-associated C-terminal domain-containing protein [Pedobacter frigidisoli]|uniref:T9SS type B sorting domain-containing protein n=1 Tax=Pedobacter frigidisoli TaxID=2530455 RepID=UPI002931C630|nr:gliding motility-associated C-terminal domain-containing protein [Pedobacter frigidisoli]
MRLRFYTFLFMACLLFLSTTVIGQTVPAGRQVITIKKGSAIALRANSGGATTYIWYKDGILVNGQNKESIVTATAGIYRVASINSFGCTSDLSDEIELVVEDIVSADVAITKRSERRNVLSNQVFEYYLDVRNNGKSDATSLNIKDALPDNLIFESISEPTVGVANYNTATRTIGWNIDFLANGNFAELIVKVRARQPGMVTNTATVTAKEFDPVLTNNTSTDQKEISGLRIPNVFTPNGDGKNDTFYLENLSAFEFNDVTVINRWGSTVFQSKGYLNDWTAPGLSDGTYFYVVKVKNGNGDWIEYKGYITLIR